MFRLFICNKSKLISLSLALFPLSVQTSQRGQRLLRRQQQHALPRRRRRRRRLDLFTQLAGRSGGGRRLLLGGFARNAGALAASALQFGALAADLGAAR